jgi:hypothetical protein
LVLVRPERPSEARKDNRRLPRKNPTFPDSIGEGGICGDYYKVQARDGNLGGIPWEAIADHLLRYTIDRENTTLAEECLFNIEHWFGRA